MKRLISGQFICISINRFVESEFVGACAKKFIDC